MKKMFFKRETTKNKNKKKLTKTKHRSGPLWWPCTSEHCQHPYCAFFKNLPLICVLSFAFVPSAPCTIDASVPAAGFEGCPERRVCVCVCPVWGFSNFGVCAHALCAILARGSPVIPCALGSQPVRVAATPGCRLFEDHKPVPLSLPAETATIGAAGDRGVASPRSPVSRVTSPCNTLGLKWTRPLGPSFLQSRGSLARTVRSGAFRRAGARTCSGCAHLLKTASSALLVSTRPRLRQSRRPLSRKRPLSRCAWTSHLSIFRTDFVETGFVPSCPTPCCKFLRPVGMIALIARCWNGLAASLNECGLGTGERVMMSPNASSSGRSDFKALLQRCEQLGLVNQKHKKAQAPASTRRCRRQGRPRAAHCCSRCLLERYLGPGVIHDGDDRLTGSHFRPQLWHPRPPG